MLGNEPLKIVISPKSYGYLGSELSKLLIEEGIYCEFSDSDYLVMLFTPEIKKATYLKLKKFFKNLQRKQPIKKKIIQPVSHKKAMEISTATLAKTEILPIDKCLGKICAEINYSCPPAVPIIMSGEIINEETIKAFNYYNIKKCRVVIE